MVRIESLLSARLFMDPEWAGDDLYFLSNMSGRLSLYRMRNGDGVPQPLLPPDIALPNPELLDGVPFRVFPALGKVLVMIDQDGDEVYQPYMIAMDGDFPAPLLPEHFQGHRAHCQIADENTNRAWFRIESLSEPVSTLIGVDLAADTVETLTRSTWGQSVACASPDGSRACLIEGYTTGDTILRFWQRGQGDVVLAGTPIEARAEGEQPPLTGFGAAEFTTAGRLLVLTALFDDAGGLALADPAQPGLLAPVAVAGISHSGGGELEGLSALGEDRFQLMYNIDGVTWLYEGVLDEPACVFAIDDVLVGRAPLAQGTVKAVHTERATGRTALSFSSATQPVQLYTITNGGIAQHTDERVLGISPGLLSPGEDASYTSWDGLRISARLYRPAPALGFSGPRPLVYYIHGGPQSQERPDFTWFSMPLIQFLTLRGFAVFVPNVRGSTGYGLAYTKHVDRDWGGSDRLDHVHALQVLAADPLIDTDRAGVVGRSYGGYMTLMLASRHPSLWKAAVDMFGPYNLITFSERIPETWKPYFAAAIGDPVKDRDDLLERSPSTGIERITCPMLVIQGRNDPRVVESESRDVADRLKAIGRAVEYLLFEDEGHDMIKFHNRVRCYNAIADFFEQHLQPGRVASG